MQPGVFSRAYVHPCARYFRPDCRRQEEKNSRDRVNSIGALHNDLSPRLGYTQPNTHQPMAANGRGRPRGGGAPKPNLPANPFGTEPEPVPANAPAPKSGAKKRGGRANAAPARTYAESRDFSLPSSLVQWAHSPEGIELIQGAAVGIGEVTFDDARRDRIVLHGDLPEEVDRAALLVESVLERRIKLQQRLAIKDKLDQERAKVQDELDRGLRVEFTVDPKFMGMVVGAKGSRIRMVQERCRIDRVVVDREACVVRIVGSDPVEVRKARNLLEVKEEIVAAPDDRARRVLIGKGGKNIQDVQKRSGAVSIDVDHTEGVVRILGTASAAAAAKVLVESLVSHLDEMDAATDELENLRWEIERLDTAWGEDNFYSRAGPAGGSPFGGGRGGRGGYGGGRGGAGGRGGGGGYGGRGGSSMAVPRQVSAPAPAPAPAPPKAKGKKNAADAKPAPAPKPSPKPAAEAKQAPKPKPESKESKPKPESKDSVPAPKPVPKPNAEAPAGALEQRPPRARRRRGGGNGGNGGEGGGAAA